ncbi:CLUMA_CG002690, isoform A [Clunio marinus]|uniref:CLUMA_CG002690, isoform A n=1 Tax=Clunio marinus TaxID=568069 RepID=A0A1J1HR94_9DIPT|nr:CLUMA_CG002690, isoform A [Clunio marinus]
MKIVTATNVRYCGNVSSHYTYGINLSKFLFLPFAESLSLRKDTRMTFVSHSIDLISIIIKAYELPLQTKEKNTVMLWASVQKEIVFLSQSLTRKYRFLSYQKFVSCYKVSARDKTKHDEIMFKVNFSANEQRNLSTIDDSTDKYKVKNICNHIMNPFAEEAMKHFSAMEYQSCSSIKPLTSIDQNFEDDTARLIIHEERISQFYNESIQSGFSCCYRKALRLETAELPDYQLHYYKCKKFKTNHLLKPDEEFLLVKCSAYENSEKKLIYVNGHSVVRMKEKVRKRIENATENKFSVLLLGLDSMSRMHFIRSMPKSFDHLRNSGWYELAFYNKVGENTFPNLASIMTGKSFEDIENIPNNKKLGGLQVLRFIWDDFKDAGYATILGEDNMSYSTFIHLREGFIEQPVDYYFHPYAILLEKNLNTSECDYLNPYFEYRAFLGFQYYIDHLYQYAYDFLRMFKNKPSFGLIWSGSFTHDDNNLPSSMDDKILDYLRKLDELEILENSIVIFFSDHGIRYGHTREHFLGWVEERLPFFFIWVPKKLQVSHPEIARNLKKNEDRLFSPYDVHLTLKHILQLVEGTENNYNEWNVTCPECQSIFEEIPINRVCEDAGITEEWCVCKSFEEVQLDSILTNTIANIVVDKLNEDLSVHPECSYLKLNSIRSIRKAELLKSSASVADYLIIFDVTPSEAVIEATVRCKDLTCTHHDIIGSVARINAYRTDGDCIDNVEQRKFCYCI